MTPDAHAVNLMASALGALQKNVGPGAFEAAGAKLMAAHAKRTGAAALGELGTAIASLRGKLSSEKNRGSGDNFW